MSFYLVSPNFVCLLHLAFHFPHQYFCDFLILIQTRQTFPLCQLNVSIGIFQRFTSFRLLKCEFSPTYAQSFYVQTLSPSFSIYIPFLHVFFLFWWISLRIILFYQYRFKFYGYFTFQMYNRYDLFFFHILIYFFLFYFIFKLYNIVLVLPNIEMNLHKFTCAPHPEPSSLLPPHTLPLGRPSTPAPSIQYRALKLDWRLISYMIFYMFKCHSPKSPQPLPLPQSP